MARYICRITGLPAVPYCSCLELPVPLRHVPPFPFQEHQLLQILPLDRSSRSFLVGMKYSRKVFYCLLIERSKEKTLPPPPNLGRVKFEPFGHFWGFVWNCLVLSPLCGQWGHSVKTFKGVVSGRKLGWGTEIRGNPFIYGHNCCMKDIQ